MSIQSNLVNIQSNLLNIQSNLINIQSNLVNIQSSLQTELSDCQLAICSPQIPPLFSDNFDFKSRSDLIREILANEDVSYLT